MNQKSIKKSTIIISTIVLVLIVSSALLLPNLTTIKEKSRRVNNLSHLNAIYKALPRPTNLQSPGNMDSKADYVLVTNNWVGNNLNDVAFFFPSPSPPAGFNLLFLESYLNYPIIKNGKLEKTVVKMY